MKDIQGLKNLIEQSRSRLGKIAGFSVIVIPLLDTHITRSYNYDLLSADASRSGDGIMSTKL
jgi:hypothetical protein